MFAQVSARIADRCLSAQKLVALIESLETASNPATAMCKGLAFVQLYSTYEYSVRASVQATLQELRAAGLEIRALRRELLALILEPHWESASSSGRARVWESRMGLIAQVDSSELTSEVRDDFFPADGSHYRVRQLQTIWRLFAIAEPVVPDPRYLGRIEELVENRNAISHGRLTAEEVGRRYSRQEIHDRMVDADTIANYVVRVLESHFRGGGMLAAAGA